MKIGMVLGLGGEASPYNRMAQLGLRIAKESFGIAYEARAPKDEDDILAHLSELMESSQFALIIAFGYASGPHIGRLSAAAERQHFAVVDARVEALNVASYIARQVDIGFLAGYAAGLLTETGTVGAIFGVDDENMRRWVHGFAAGAVHRARTTRVLYSFVGSWDDPSKAYELAFRQFDAGADIIMAHANNGDVGILEAAEESGRYVIGWSGEREQHPRRVLFDIERHAEVCVVDAVRMVVKGTFRGGVYVFGLAEGNWDLTLTDANPRVSRDVKRQIAEAKAGIIQGKLSIPSPINLSISGAERVD